MQIKKQQLELDMEQQTGSKSGKEYIKAVHCPPAYLTYMRSTSWETLTGLEEAQAGNPPTIEKKPFPYQHSSLLVSYVPFLNMNGQQWSPAIWEKHLKMRDSSEQKLTT